MIYLASDHGGYELKEFIKNNYLLPNNIEFEDCGCDSDDSCDYPDFAHIASNKINNSSDVGIFVCGTGNGINMTANSHSNIRGALCWKKDIAELARSHNNANVMSLPGRHISNQEALECVESFLNTEFEGGRHQRRIDKIK